MTTFYLIRHGECRGISEVLWGRSPNVHLSAEGKHSAKVVARKLSPLNLEMVYSSPLERAMETAHEISSGCSLPTIINKHFNEIDYGEWTGESFPTLAEKPLWRKYNAFRSGALIPGGESLQNARKRIVSEMGRLTDLHRDQRIAIVTHAEPIRIALSYFHPERWVWAVLTAPRKQARDLLFPARQVALPAPNGIATRVPLDESEGVVKAQFYIPVQRTPRVGQRRWRPRLWTSRAESFLGEIVPPTIDTAATSAMILPCESRSPAPGRERPINASVWP